MTKGDECSTFIPFVCMSQWTSVHDQRCLWCLTFAAMATLGTNRIGNTVKLGTAAKQSKKRNPANDGNEQQKNVDQDGKTTASLGFGDGCYVHSGSTAAAIHLQ